MKTTLDIADPLLREAKQLAARDGTTLRALVEQGLQQVVAQRSPKAKGFRLRDASVGGKGLTDDFKNATPDQWLHMMYGEQPGFDRD